MSAVGSKLGKHPVGYTCFFVLLVISCVQWARDTRDRIEEMIWGGTYVAGPFDLDSFTMKVTGLDPSAEASGLRNGDSLVSVEGRPFEGYADYHKELRRMRFGDSLHVRAKSGAVEKDVVIRPPRFTYLGYVPGESVGYPYILLLRITIPILCMALGFWVVAVRVTDSAAWQLLLLMLSVANMIQDSRTVFGNDDQLQPFLTAFSFGFSTLSPMTLAFFGIVFPERLKIDRRFPWLKWVILVPLLVRAVFAAIGGYLLQHHVALALAMVPVTLPFVTLGLYLTPLAIAIFFAALAYQTVKAGSRDARRRMLVLDVGAAVSILPFVAMITLGEKGWIQFQGLAAMVPTVLLTILPLTMAYVIIVHRAMDVRVAIRQGLQYVLAKGGVRVVQVVISVIIVVTAATMSADSSVLKRVVWISAGFALLAGMGGFAQRLRGWIDRKFFREAYNAEHVLSELSEEVRTVVQKDRLIEMVCRRISESLHVPRIAMLLRNGTGYEAAFALGYEETVETKFAADGPVQARLEESRQPLYADDSRSWGDVELDGHPDRERLRDLTSQVLLPIESRERLVGFISLGAKRSEEPYNATDLRLLRSVAAQTGLALENSRLTEAAATEAAQREVLNRELEIAREVQQRLFPQVTPAMEGLELAGACRPALSVGGDYYDFLKLSDGQLAMAVGDVSGKGVPAAILMAVLQTSVRGQAMARPAELRTLIGHVNLQVAESSGKSHFATLFYAQYEPGTKVLRYVNAGHNPPLVIRASGEKEWLRSTGVAVGWSKRVSFQEASISLASGDVLFAYTDGFTEAMNEGKEEFGEERLAEAAARCRGLGMESIVPALMEAVDQFTNGAPQNDDMTLVVMRVR